MMGISQGGRKWELSKKVIAKTIALRSDVGIGYGAT